MNRYYKTIHENIPSYSDYYCLEPNFNISLQNAFANIGDNAYLNIYLSSCDNKTEEIKGSGVVCQPQSKIDLYLSSYSARLAVYDTYLDHENFKQPLHPFLNTLIYQGSAKNNQYGRLNAYVQNQMYITDIGWMFETNEENNRINLVSSDKITDTRLPHQKLLPNAFFQFTFANDPRGFYTKYNRSYKKVQNVVADIGGFINILSIISIIVATFFSQISYWEIILKSCSALVAADLKAEVGGINDIRCSIKNNQVDCNDNENKDKIEYINESSEQDYKDNNNNLIIISNKEKYERIKKLVTKVNFIKPTYKDQCFVILKNSLCPCFKKSENENLVIGLNNYHKHIIDVRTVITLHNDIKLLKSLLMTKSQNKLFDSISFIRNSEELKVYENEDEEYEKLITKEEDEKVNLLDRLSILKDSVNDKITLGLLDMFEEKISDHCKEII